MFYGSDCWVVDSRILTASTSVAEMRMREFMSVVTTEDKRQGIRTRMVDPKKLGGPSLNQKLFNHILQ